MSRRTLLAVAALAAAALLLESTLTRLLAVAQFYHFAFLAVSLALLGFGASGTLLSLAPRLAREVPVERTLAGSGAAFALSAALAYATVNLLPFDSYSIAWERRQLLYFALYYLALALPFLAAGLGIAAALAASAGRSHRVYAANLLGSGAGVLLAPALLELAGVPGAVLASALIGLLPAVGAAWAGLTPRTAADESRYTTGVEPLGGLVREREQPAKASTPERAAKTVTQAGSLHYRVGVVVWAACVTLLVLGLAGLTWLTAANLADRAPLGMTISPYKGLAHALRYPGSTVLFARWSALSRADVVAGAGTHLLPGLSYTYAGLPPLQHGLSLDADSVQPISLISSENFDAAAYLPEALAFELRPAARTLVLESAGGLGLLQALAGGAESVTAVVGDPTVLRALTVANPNDPYAHPRVRTVQASARAFLAADRARYDVVFLPLTDAYRPVASGAYSLAESYHLTVEALDAALARLAPTGLLVATRWLQTPPSEDLRLVATLVEALARRGIGRPADALVAYRGIQTLTVIVRPDGWEAGELADVRAFAAARRYDLVWAPAIRPEEVNRFNRTPTPEHFEAVRTLLAAADRRAFYAAYPFAVAPATDDQPFFFHFFRWGQTPQVLATLGRAWQPFGGSGYLILLALLALTLLLSALLIVLPLVVLRGSRGFSRFRRASAKPPKGSTPVGSTVSRWNRGLSRFRCASAKQEILRFVTPSREVRDRAAQNDGLGNKGGRSFLYFALLGIAFLFVEIPLIQRGILLFGHPIYAFTIVVLTLLVFSSAGSLLARAAWLPRRGVFIALAALAVIVALAGPRAGDLLLSWSTWARMGAVVVGLAPLAVLMGLPFPIGLAWLEANAPGLTPWAWAVNGCASVIAAIMAALVSLSFGFTTVLLAGAGVYALAGWLLRHRDL